MRLQGQERLLGKRHIAVPATFRRSLLIAPQRAADDEVTGDEVHVLPLEGEELAHLETISRKRGLSAWLASRLVHQKRALNLASSPSIPTIDVSRLLAIVSTITARFTWATRVECDRRQEVTGRRVEAPHRADGLQGLPSADSKGFGGDPEMSEPTQRHDVLNLTNVQEHVLP